MIHIIRALVFELRSCTKCKIEIRGRGTMKDQEKEEELQAAMAQEENNSDPQPKKRKTHEDLARRARRVCIRLASMGNR